MPSLVKPHGGWLVERVLSGETARAAAARAQRFPSIELDRVHVGALELLAGGGAAPLRGFMRQDEYRSVLDRQRLPSGLLFPVPLVLPVRPARLGAFPPGTEVALRDELGSVRGTLIVTDAFARNLREEALLQYGSADPAHPRVAQLLKEPPGALGGEVTLVAAPDDSFESARGVRLRLARHGYLRVVAGFGAVPPQLPAGADGGIDALLVRSLEDAVALAPHLPVVVARGLPAMRPRSTARELLFHAVVLKNFGASHLAVPGTPRDLASADALLRARLELGMTLLRGPGPHPAGAPPGRRAA